MASSSSAAHAVGDGATSDTEPVVESFDQITSEREWTRLHLHGTVPAPRYKHAAIAVGRRMFITGGTSPQGKSNEILMFHSEKLTWESLRCQNPVSDLKVTRGEQQDSPCRSCTGHSLVLWENQFVLVGCQAKSASKTVTVVSLNLSSLAWSTLSPKGKAPTARTGHTVIQMASMLVLFGGEDMKGHTLNDIYILELKTFLWLPLETSGSKPPPRRDHCAASYSERYLWIFGGKSKSNYYNDLYCLDFKNMEWTKGKARSRNPMVRAGHSGTVAGNKWYIVGGESREKEVLKTLAFNLDTQEWLEFANIRPGSPLAHEGISLVKLQSKGRTFAVAFGGHTTQPSNLIYVMLLPSADSMADILSDTSSGSSNSFDSVDSMKPLIKGSESPPSIRISNASSGGGGGSTPDSTFSLGDLSNRNCLEPATHGVAADTEDAKSQRSKPKIRLREIFSTIDAADDEDAEYGTDMENPIELQKLPEVHPVQIEETLSSPARNSGEPSNKGSPEFVLASANLDPDPPNGMPESDISGDLNENLLAALKLNEDLQNKLRQTHDAKVELEQALSGSMAKTAHLDQRVLNLVISQADGVWKLEEARRRVEELEGKLNSPSMRLEDADLISPSASREDQKTESSNSLRTRLFEESAFDVDTETNYEAQKRLEEVENELSTLQNTLHLTESKLQTATREKRELSENTANAKQMLDESRSANKTLRDENVRLEQELLAMKATLDDIQAELLGKQLELAQATARNIELQVEMHELWQKISGS